MENVIIRAMQLSDYDKVYALWQGISGFGLRSIDDSKEGIEKFLKRNPNTSVVAVSGNEIVGSVLCGHDGRTGYMYHLCVKKEMRRHGIGKEMVVRAMRMLSEEGINKVSLLAFRDNKGGNAFWHQVGWKEREDVNFYDFVLNEENITAFNAGEEN
jgi:ribosomal protein S18 acetylase RimI-like enzyme